MGGDLSCRMGERKAPHMRIPLSCRMGEREAPHMRIMAHFLLILAKPLARS